MGIAPEASLCVVKVDYSGPAGASAADVIDGVAYIFAKAAALGMPAVVILSLGTHEGPHDGTLPLDEMLEAMTGPGWIIVAAAGNEGADRIHGRADVPTGGTSELTFRVPGYTPNAGAGNDLVRLSVWHDRAAPLGDVEGAMLARRGGRIGASRRVCRRSVPGIECAVGRLGARSRGRRYDSLAREFRLRDCCRRPRDEAVLVEPSMATSAVAGAIALLLAQSGWASAGPTRV